MKWHPISIHLTFNFIECSCIHFIDIHLIIFHGQHDAIVHVHIVKHVLKAVDDHVGILVLRPNICNEISISHNI